MAIFIWEAKNRKGEERKGEIEGENIGQVASLLRKQGMRDPKVKKKPKPGGLFKPTKVEEMEIVIFTRQLATMVGSGLPLIQCFDLSAKGAENPLVSEIAIRVKESIEGGATLTDAMIKEPKMFDELFVNLVQAGEKSGILETVLDRLAVYKEKSAALKAKIKSAMTYPIAVLVVAFVITGVLMIFVVPSFAELFQGFGAELPLPTRVVVAMSEWTQVYWWVVILVIGSALSAHKHAYLKSEKYHYQADALALRLPVFGMILRKAVVARFARTFATMIAAGTPILECLDSVAKTAGNLVVEEAVNNSKASISEGQSLTEPLADSGIFPVMVTQMISIGENTGKLDMMLEKIAEFYEAEVDRAVESLTALLEPIILVILGTLVGGLVVAMYLPIFQLGDVVG